MNQTTSSNNEHVDGFSDSQQHVEGSSTLLLQHPESDESARSIVLDDVRPQERFQDTQAGALSLDEALVTLPLIGSAPLRKQVTRLKWLIGAGVLLLLLGLFLGISQSRERASRYLLVNESLVQAQRLSAATARSISGQSDVYSEITNSGERLVQNVSSLAQQDAPSQQQREVLVPAIQLLPDIRASLQQTASGIRALQNRDSALADIEKNASRLGEIARSISSQTSSTTANRLFSASEGILNAAAALRLSDSDPRTILNSLQQSWQVAGDAALLLRGQTASADLANAITEALNLHRDLNSSIETLQANAEPAQLSTQGIHSLMNQANQAIPPLSLVREQAGNNLGWGLSHQLQVVLGALLATVGGWLMANVYIQNSRTKYAQAEKQQIAANAREQDAKRLNEANQAAILRLMNELLQIAEGDLTQEATVTEDITGAIADSVNYTIEELRNLIASVQISADKVAQTTAQVDTTSTELLAASTEQQREIRDTGRSVLDMAQRINQVSAQAQESSTVARQSRTAAESGLKAVQDTIGGMNAIRAQIQESSKRIKRLGESSQEIGEITELISDITEQTNVLALNAAIQAASAGEAGRGFSVVAEEVQRLAERSADATRQIAALVKAIQSDTQDAVAAMERSTAGVVEGASLSDKAGTALSEIDQVSRTLSDLVEQISNTALREASFASQVAENIQHILAVTEQTGEGTRSTAQQVRELSHIAAELHQSIARFKIQ